MVLILCHFISELERQRSQLELNPPLDTNELEEKLRSVKPKSPRISLSD